MLCVQMVKRIQSHMQMHDEEKQHKCPVCSKLFFRNLIVNWFKVIEIFFIFRLSEQNTIYHGTKIFIALRRYCVGLECGTY